MQYNTEIQPNYDGLFGMQKEHRVYSVDLANSSLFGQKPEVRRGSISTNYASQRGTLLA